MERHPSVLVTVLATTLLGLALIATGCTDKPDDDEASIQKTLNDQGTVDVMEKVAKAPEYQPPADGHLSDPQVKMYIEVRQREHKIREVALKNLKAKGDKAKAEKKEVGMFEAMKAMGDLADVATADLRAAQELGHNPNEYTWIKERVLEVDMLQMTKTVNKQLVQGQQSLVTMLEEQKKLVTDDAQRAELDQQIAEMKQSAAEAAADSTPAKEYNAGLLARYKNEFDKLKAEDTRIAQELNDSGSQGSGR